MRVVSLSLLALSSFACGDEQSQDVGSYGPVGSGDCTDATGAYEPSKWIQCAPEDTVAISLVNKGVGQERELRIQAESGHEEDNRMSMDIVMSMGMGPMGKMDMDLPTMIIDMNTKVLETLADGNIRSAVTMSAIDVGPATGMMAGMEGELKAALQELVGLSGEVVTSSTGYVVSGGFEAPEGAGEDILQQLESMNESLGNSSVPVPKEAIAPGAVWETLMRDKSNGMDLVQHTRAELVSWEGSDALIKSTLTQVVASNTPQMDDMPEGAEVEIKSFKSEGSGDIRMRQGFVNPVDSTSKVQLDMVMSVKAEGQEMEMEMSTGIEASFRYIEPVVEDK